MANLTSQNWSDKNSKTPLDVADVKKVISICKDQGFIIGKNGVTVAGFNNILTLSPPLIITSNEKDFIVEKFTTALNTLLQQP